MDIFDLMDKLEDINNESDCPEIYIQIRDTQVPLRSVKYYPENDVVYESIVLSSEDEPKLTL